MSADSFEDLFDEGTNSGTSWPTSTNDMTGRAALPEQSNQAEQIARAAAAIGERHVPAQTAPESEVGVYNSPHGVPMDTRKKLARNSSTIKNLITGAPELNEMTGRFVITRDHDLDKSQLNEFGAALNHYKDRFTEGMQSNQLQALYQIVYDDIIGLGPLGGPWRDDDVTEILVDAYDRIYLEKDGELLYTDLEFESMQEAQSVARAMATKVSNRGLSPANPLVTAQLDRARVNFAFGEAITPTGLAITIRKFKPLMGMNALVDVGALLPDMREFLDAAVEARATILVSGGTGVGKTTLINALSEAIPDNERVITIEDSLELALQNRYVVSLQTKESASSDDTIEVTQADLLRNCLRMRPDRIVVGEIRDGEAADVMLQAANTGHDGTMTTIHANFPDVAVNQRLAGLVRSVGTGVPDDVAKYSISTAFDLVVQATRTKGRRFISHVSLVGDLYSPNSGGSEMIQLTTLFEQRYNPTTGTLEHRRSFLDPDSMLAKKMEEAGVDHAKWSSGFSKGN